MDYISLEKNRTGVKVGGLGGMEMIGVTGLQSTK
jgi:hypothetical protein